MSVKIDKSTDNVYVNSIMTHQISDGNNPSLAKVNLGFTEPYLTSPQDYYASIIRFDIPMNEVPLFIFPCPNGGTTSSLIVGVTVGGMDFPRNLIYVPDDSLFTAPVNPDPTNPFYYTYTIQNFVDSLEAALNAAFADAGSPGGVAPFFYYDSVTQLFNCYIPQTFIAAGATIFVNTELEIFLDGFRWDKVSTTAVNGHHFDLLISSNPFYTYPSVLNPTSNGLVGTPTAVILKQDYINMVYFASLRRIVIVTNSIPIIAENVPTVAANGIQTGDVGYLPIFSDFVPNFRDTTDIRSIAYYEPTGQYRLLDLKGNTALHKFDLQIFWEDTQGRLLPFFLTINQTASIKVGFFKKSLYKDSTKK